MAGGTGAVGRPTVAAAEAAGHEVIVLARSTGVDVRSGASLTGALDGIDVVIDVTSIGTLSTGKAVAFFRDATTHLLETSEAAGVRHVIALSIIGARGVDSGYYAGKTVQEELVEQARIGWTILRASQFHEFAAQRARQRVLGTVIAPKMRSQPIAASEVAAVLVEIAMGDPRGLDRDLAGPQEENMADMIRRYLAAIGDRARVQEVAIPGDMGKVSSSGGLLAGPDARLGAQTFEDWLHSPDLRTV